MEEALARGYKWATIVIDPPWDYEETGSHAGVPYHTMKYKDILGLTIPAMPDCHLYLWITNRFLLKAAEVLESWGFEPSAILTWHKKQILKDGSQTPRGRGTGSFVITTEHVIFARRGQMPIKRQDAETHFDYAIPRRELTHSKKPPEFLGLVESCSPGPYLEIFSRSDRDGWSSIGENGLKLAPGILLPST